MQVFNVKSIASKSILAYKWKSQPVLGKLIAFKLLISTGFFLLVISFMEPDIFAMIACRLSLLTIAPNSVTQSQILDERPNVCSHGLALPHLETAFAKCYLFS